MSETITEQVRAIAADLFEVPVEEVTESSSPETIEAWDSLQHLNLMVELQMQFGVNFTPKETATMTSIASVAAVLDTKLKQGRGTAAGDGGR